MAHGIALSGAQGHMGYLSDYRHVVDCPMDKLLALEVPVRVLIGGQSRPEEAANLRFAIQRKQNFKEKMLEDAGTFLFFSHSEDVVDSLEEVAEIVSGDEP